MEKTEESLRQGGRTNWLITGGVVIALILLVAYGLREQSPLEQGLAPDFTLSLLDGGEVRLADLSGQVVVLNFWASWCQPCRDEAPALNRAWQVYRDRGVTMIGVAFKDTKAQASAFVARHELNYPNGLDRRNQIAGAYAVTAIPETFVIAPNGRITAHFVGGVTEAQLSAALDAALQEQ
ncbi:MAG: TlpA family protein disulfide reductase [Chloroflexi bacterium]|nr:TlpA family protein disulfide reductase [Chloroflexota bacterium]